MRVTALTRTAFTQSQLIPIDAAVDICANMDIGASMNISANHKPPMALPLHSTRVACGFPSPADDHLEGALDLNDHLIKHPAASYFVRAEGDSLINKGIYSGDLLVVDRALKAQHGDIVIAAIDGQLLCKILDLKNNALVSANTHYPPIELTEAMDLIIEGVVVHAVHHLRR